MEQKTTVNDNINIAIDGFSACGKSTLAKDLAKELGYLFVDSGAMYRAVTLYAISNDFYYDDGALDKDSLVKALDGINVTFNYRPNFKKNHVFLNGVDVEEEIRKPYIAKKVSAIASVPEVRKKLVSLQQELGKAKGVVMDGRDIGTVVFPDAELKLFVTATIEERVRRRHLELYKKNIQISFEELQADLQKRDEQDMTREADPLVQAEDAVLVDNTELSKEEQLDLVLDLVNKTLQQK